MFINPSAAVVAFICNSRGELLVVVRDCEPAKGTLDLPGGFTDIDETVEESVIREIKEETGLTVTATTYLFSYPNHYLYSGCQWLPLNEIQPERFGLKSIRQGVIRYLKPRS